MTGNAKSPATPKKKVLLVDDRLSWLRLIQSIIGVDRLTTCSDPRNVVGLLNTDEFDLLVADTNMPQLTGIELLALIRSDAALKDFPVIVLFEGLHGADLTKEDVLKAGATLVMTKDDFFAQCKTLLAGG